MLFRSATCHGFSAALGKLGAFVGTVTFKPIEENWGADWAFIMCALICLVSIPITHFFVQDRTGDLVLLDIELQNFLKKEDIQTQARLSASYFKTMQTEGTTPKYFENGVLTPIEPKSPLSHPDCNVYIKVVEEDK